MHSQRVTLQKYNPIRIKKICCLSHFSFSIKNIPYLPHLFLPIRSVLLKLQRFILVVMLRSIIAKWNTSFLRKREKSLLSNGVQATVTSLVINRRTHGLAKKFVRLWVTKNVTVARNPYDPTWYFSRSLMTQLDTFLPLRRIKRIFCNKIQYNCVFLHVDADTG